MWAERISLPEELFWAMTQESLQQQQTVLPCFNLQKKKKKKVNRNKREMESVMSVTTCWVSGAQTTEPSQGQSGRSLLTPVGYWEF